MKIKRIILYTLISLILTIPAFSTSFDKNYMEVGIVSENERYMVNRAISDVSDSVIERLVANNYIFVLTSNDLQSMFTKGVSSGGWSGATDDELRWICVQAGNPPDQMYNTALHEIGHGLNNINNHFSNTPEWQQCYLYEKPVIAPYLDPNNLYNASEYFSECFNMYYINKEILQMCAPISCQYIENLIQNGE